MQRDASARSAQQPASRSASAAIFVHISRWARPIYAVVAWLFVACILAQVFLAGLSVFTGPKWWAVHIETGHLFGAFTFALLLLALLGRLPRLSLGLSALLLVLYTIQYLSISLAGSLGAPWLAALHPVNALFIFLLALTLARRSLPYLRAPR